MTINLHDAPTSDAQSQRSGIAAGFRTLVAKLTGHAGDRPRDASAPGVCVWDENLCRYREVDLTNRDDSLWATAREVARVERAMRGLDDRRAA